MSSDRARRRWPALTVLAVALTAVGAVAQAVDPTLLDSLRRSPGALAAGEWWRLVTPLLVLDGNMWLHFMTDAVGLLAVGSVVELRFGRRVWLVSLLAGAAAGELAGYAWDPSGAGASVALGGLIGGLLVAQLRSEAFDAVGSIVSVTLVSLWAAAALTAGQGSDTAGYVLGSIASAALVYPLIALRRRDSNRHAATLFVGAVVVLGALIMVLSRDIHGVAILAGIGASAVLVVGKSRLERTGHVPV